MYILLYIGITYRDNYHFNLYYILKNNILLKIKIYNLTEF